MISRIIKVLRPLCVLSTVVFGIILTLCFWGIEVVSWDTFWRLTFSYLALMVASTVICYIDDPGRVIGRR